MALIPLYGGKWRMSKHLLPLITEHVTYVEHFMGGAALFFKKPLSELEVLNDVDGELINFFRVLRDEEKFDRFWRAVAMTPYSREEFDLALNLNGDDIERARKFFVLAMQSFSGNCQGWSASTTSTSKKTWAWLNRLKHLPEFHARLMVTQIENLDFRDSLCKYDDPWTFHYLDPPYLYKTRIAKSQYRFEMSERDHEQMIDLILQLCGKVMLSGYRNEMYDRRLADWHRLDFEVKASAHSQAWFIPDRKQPQRIESIWLNERAYRASVQSSNAGGVHSSVGATGTV